MSVDRSVMDGSRVAPQGLHLLLVVDGRLLAKDLVGLIQGKLAHLEGEYPASLEVVDVGERPYVAEHYKLVATPALVKSHPLPAQVLVGNDLATQMEVWWPRWQQQAAAAQQRDPDPSGSAAESMLRLQLSEEIFALRQEQAQLREQLAFKDRILGMLAHDLRSPLTSTSLVLETLLQHDLDPQMRRQLLEQGRSQMRKMEELITDILEAARSSEVVFRLHSRETHLEEIFQSVMDEFLPRIKANLTLCTDIPAQFPAVHVDQERIRQVFVNLLDNAVKYTPPNGKISVAFLHRTTQKVQVSIADTGPGIPDEAKEKIFCEAVRLIEDKGGYGIGLALCRRIIRAHYGHIWVEDAEPCGSVFHFTLPVYR
ncbi:MAG: histidine kinase [Thermostichales cyanobacterium DRC_bins_46]